jgi:superfamily II DNA or RNA helicase
VITLRPYQSEAIEALRGSFRAGHHSPLLVMPTGAGKTVCFSYLTQRLTAAGKRVTILVHREELIRQVSDTLRAFEGDHGLIAAGAL